MRHERKSPHRIGRALANPPTESCDADNVASSFAVIALFGA